MKIKLTVLLVLTALLSFADGTVANTLHYTKVEKSVDRKGNTVEKKEDMEFYQNDNVLYGEKKNEHRSFPSYYFDLNKGAVIVDHMGGDKGYIVEDISVRYGKGDELKATNESKTINGYNCKKYELTKVFKRHFGSAVTDAYTYTYVLWITKDITFKNEFNSYMFAVMNHDYTNDLTSFDGVLVELDTKMVYGKKEYNYVTSLDVSKLKDNHTIPPMPWTVDGTSAWVQAVTIAGGGKIFYVDNGSEKRSEKKVREEQDRMKEFALKVSGNDKMKTTPMLNIPFFGFW